MTSCECCDNDATHTRVKGTTDGPVEETLCDECGDRANKTCISCENKTSNVEPLQTATGTIQAPVCFQCLNSGE